MYGFSGRIFGKWNRISGRIPDFKNGQISGQPDIRYNPKKNTPCLIFSYISEKNILNVQILENRFFFDIN